MNCLKTMAFAIIATAFITLNTQSIICQSRANQNINIPAELKLVNNPIISGMGVCDPHIHIFNNKAYLFASHDREPGGRFYGMYDWWVWSSSDLVHWEMEFNLFPKDMWVGPTNNSWAVDGAERNGKYYFYVSGNWNTGVAVSTNGPGGPYKDALGKALVSNYDPTVFVDDDANKTPYLIWGKFPYKIAKLNEDMISLAEEQKDIIHTANEWNGDGGFLHKRNGIYYLNGHGSNYKTATNIYGPYTMKGKFYSEWIDHPSFFTWHNQTYCAFGRGDVDRLFRKTHLTYVHYKDNGEFVADSNVGSSFIGVGQYDCSRKIEAEWYFSATDGTKKLVVDSGFAVGNMAHNASLFFPRILNMAANASITIKLASLQAGGTIEVRNDNANGTLLGKIKVQVTGSSSTYRTVTTKLKNKAGLTNICLVYKGLKDSKLSVDWLNISSTGAIIEPPKRKPNRIEAGLQANTPSRNAYQQMEAEDLVCYAVLRVVVDKNDSTTKYLSCLKNNSYSSYKIDFGQKSNDSITFQCKLSSVKSGKIEIRLDSIAGNLLGTCEFGNTEGLQKWVTKTCNVNAPNGTQHVFLVFRMEEEEKYHNSAESLNLDWIKFIR